MNRMNIYVDCGNSRIKVRFENGTISIIPKPDTIASFAEQLDQSVHYNFIYSAVNIKNFNMFRTNIEFIITNSEFINAKSLLEKQMFLNYKHIAGIGSDRLLGLLGGFSYNYGNKPSQSAIVTIDCGTAVTVNVADGSGEVLGGAIFAGINTQLRGLAELTENLQFSEINKDAGFIGINTHTAVSFGVVSSVCGGITEVLNRLKLSDSIDEESKIFLTGGDSELILSFLKNNFNIIHKRDLVIDGIVFLSDVLIK